MIEPVAFQFNEQTAINNFYQKKIPLSAIETQKQALAEFNALVNKLKDKGVNVITIKDNEDLKTPDSIFPNNWISFHEDKRIVLYPMFAKNRRYERRSDIIEDLRDQHHFYVSKIVDYSSFEDEGCYLEGTGSLILDRENKLCYAAISERTNKKLVLKFCADFNYEPICFTANQTIKGERLPIYHTNVMLCIGNEYAVVCLDAIDDLAEKELVRNKLFSSGKDIIQITEEQKNNFAGNVLQVFGDQPYLVMSSKAYKCLTKAQLVKISSYNTIIHSNLDTIEKCGGGSARCMMAEIFLPVK
jgi:hypothetical protein